VPCREWQPYRTVAADGAPARTTPAGRLIVGAPAIVRASSLMPVKVVEWTPLAPSANEKHYTGWIDRLAYKMMVLKAGWAPERAAPFYGGM
jgi:hypothetical protein